MIITIMGYGKGKTESAIGCTVRALANHEKVLFVQFLKDGKSSEVDFLNKYSDITFMYIPWDKISLPSNVNEVDKEKFNLFLDEIITELYRNKYGLVVLDEVLPAIDLGLMSFDELIDIISIPSEVDENSSTDFYLTGRARSHKLREEVRKLSDICSDAYCKKHCFDTYCKSCDNTFPYYFKYCPQCGSVLEISKPSKKGRDY